MNSDTRDIVEITGLSVADALRVQAHLMTAAGWRFDTCTASQFRREVLAAVKVLGLTCR